jgi:hypothetical protein
MNIHKVAHGAHAVLEGRPATPLLQAPDDVVALIGACFEQQVRSVLLYAENLSPRFFDLSSGEAGAILQKLRNYYIRLAVVEAPGGSPHSPSFQALMREENRGPYFRLFADHAAALAWLLGEQ